MASPLNMITIEQLGHYQAPYTPGLVQLFDSVRNTAVCKAEITEIAGPAQLSDIKGSHPSVSCLYPNVTNAACIIPIHTLLSCIFMAIEDCHVTTVGKYFGDCHLMPD